jgi:aryl-alcohol dehydrogenase-like predicted oxidoreductase
VETLTRFAADNGHTILDLAISVPASTPGIASVIAGATSADQVRANAAAGRWQVPEDVLRELADL